MVCGLLVNKPAVRDVICTYYRNCVFNRLSEPTAHGLQTMPENKSILLAEMTDYTLRENNLNTDEDILKRVVDDIVSLGLIKKEDVADSCVFRYDEAYPIYHIGFQNDLKIVFKYLKSLNNIFTTGRQGLFRYVNIHATMQLAIQKARSIR
jgi:protoporphyrinogen oxidase